MKSISSILVTLILLGFLTIMSTASPAQAVAPGKSAKAAVIDDARFIAAGIADNEDVMFLSQKAIDRATDERVKELAQKMLDDHSVMLYTLEQLEAAGTGSSRQKAGNREEDHREAAILNGRLSGVAGPDFDTMWVSNILIMRQAKYNELTAAKETATNPQLKMAITSAIPQISKHITQLKSIQKYLTRMAVQRKKEAAAQKTK